MIMDELLRAENNMPDSPPRLFPNDAMGESSPNQHSTGRLPLHDKLHAKFAKTNKQTNDGVFKAPAPVSQSKSTNATPKSGGPSVPGVSGESGLSAQSSFNGSSLKAAMDKDVVKRFYSSKRTAVESVDSCETDSEATDSPPNELSVDLSSATADTNGTTLPSRRDSATASARKRLRGLPTVPEGDDDADDQISAIVSTATHSTISDPDESDAGGTDITAATTARHQREQQANEELGYEGADSVEHIQADRRAAAERQKGLPSFAVATPAQKTEMIKKVTSNFPSSGTGTVEKIGELTDWTLEYVKDLKQGLPSWFNFHGMMLDNFSSAMLHPAQVFYRRQQQNEDPKNKSRVQVSETIFSDFPVENVETDAELEDETDVNDANHSDSSSSSDEQNTTAASSSSTTGTEKKYDKDPAVVKLRTAEEADRILKSRDFYRWANGNASPASKVIRNFNDVWLHVAPKEIVTQPVPSTYAHELFKLSVEERQRSSAKKRNERNAKKDNQASAKGAAEAAKRIQEDFDENDDLSSAPDREHITALDRARISNAEMLHKKLFRLWHQNKMPERSDKDKAVFLNQFLWQPTYHAAVEHIYLFTLLLRDRMVELSFCDVIMEDAKSPPGQKKEIDVTLPFVSDVIAPTKAVQIYTQYRKDRLAGASHDRATFSMPLTVAKWRQFRNNYVAMMREAASTSSSARLNPSSSSRNG